MPQLITVLHDTVYYIVAVIIPSKLGNFYITMILKKEARVLARKKRFVR
jgi:hypothetical protein